MTQSRHIEAISEAISVFLVLIALPLIAIGEEKGGDDARPPAAKETEGPPSSEETQDDAVTAPRFSAPLPGGAVEANVSKVAEHPVDDSVTAAEIEGGEEGGEPVTGAEAEDVPAEAGSGVAEVSEDTGRPRQQINGRLEIETEPEGARISIGVVGGPSQEAGVTPLPLKLPANQYRVTLEKEGFETAVAEVVVEKGRVARLRVKLEQGRSGASRGLRLAGHILFWPGLATAVTGIALLVADNPEKNVNTGKAGFAVAGVGVAMTVLGGIFLGVTHRDTSVYTIPPVALGTTPDGSGPAISFQKQF